MSFAILVEDFVELLRWLIAICYLVFGAVDLIMSPLFERNVSADKENKPANSVVLFLNDSK